VLMFVGRAAPVAREHDLPALYADHAATRLELRQPLFLGFQHFVYHALDLGQGANCRRERIQHDSVIDSIGAPG
jgi:hypothetical protein